MNDVHEQRSQKLYRSIFTHMARNSAVRRVAKILKSFSAETPEMGVTELATKLDLAKSVIHGDLATLVEENILEKGKDTGRYFLGGEIYRLGQAVSKQMTLKRVAFPVMERLSKITMETITLGGWVNFTPTCIERINSIQPLKFSVELGSWFPLHAGSVGKILLAFLPDEERERMIEKIELTRYTENTITEISVLIKTLQEIRKNGYAVSIGERWVDVVSIGAPIRNYNGNVTAVLSIGGPKSRFKEEKMAGFIQLVSEGTREISLKLGFSG